MTLIADGFEGDVYKSKFEITCPGCGYATPTDVIGVLGGAEPSDKFAEQAEEDHVQSQVGRIMCGGCGAELSLYFGHGEVQPARYQFLLYEVVQL